MRQALGGAAQQVLLEVTDGKRQRHVVLGLAKTNDVSNFAIDLLLNR
jgi:hypothetical protein